MPLSNGVGGLEGGEFVGELAKGAAEAVVGAVVGGLADCVATEDSGVAVIVVGGVSCEVNFAEETLFVMAEFAHHIGGVVRCVWEGCREG